VPDVVCRSLVGVVATACQSLSKVMTNLHHDRLFQSQARKLKTSTVFVMLYKVFSICLRFQDEDAENELL